MAHLTPKCIFFYKAPSVEEYTFFFGFTHGFYCVWLVYSSMLRVVADKKRRMESSVPMIMADRKANGVHFQEKGSGKQSEESLPHSTHGIWLHEYPRIYKLVNYHNSPSKKFRWKVGEHLFRFVEKTCRNPFIISMKHLEKEKKNDWTWLTNLKCRLMSCTHYLEWVT